MNEVKIVEDMVVHSLVFLYSWRQVVSNWVDDVDKGDVQFSWKESELYARPFRWWLQHAGEIISSIQEYELKGFEVNRAKELREAYRDVSLMRLDIERAKKEHEATTTIPLEQAMKELKRWVEDSDAPHPS